MQISVAMMNRGAYASLSFGKDSYTILAGCNLIIVTKNGEQLFSENDVLDPLNPSETEEFVLNMSRDLEGLDAKMYSIACGLAILYNNDADDGYATRWLEAIIEEFHE